MLLSRCGIDCEKCINRRECDCPGCTELEEGNWAGNCEIKKCCEQKFLPHCGKCPAFPCDMLRNTAFDPEEGDDGERLIDLKHITEEEPSHLETVATRVVVGFLVGAVLGAVLGAFSGNVLPITVAGVLAGTAIGIMVNIFKGDRQ